MALHWGMGTRGGPWFAPLKPEEPGRRFPNGKCRRRCAAESNANTNKCKSEQLGIIKDYNKSQLKNSGLGKHGCSQSAAAAAEDGVKSLPPSPNSQTHI
jgi:hypothetical protein